MMLGVEDIEVILLRMAGVAEPLYRREDCRKYICQACVLGGTVDIKSDKLPQWILLLLQMVVDEVRSGVFLEPFNDQVESQF